MDEYNNQMNQSGKVEDEARGVPALIPSQIGQINFHGDELQDKRTYISMANFERIKAARQAAAEGNH